MGAEAWIACFIRLYRWAAGERLSPAKVALQYMENPNFSIQEAGRIMGFKDLSNFSRAFKRWTSISPTEYRNMARSDHQTS